MQGCIAPGFPNDLVCPANNSKKPGFTPGFESGTKNYKDKNLSCQGLFNLGQVKYLLKTHRTETVLKDAIAAPEAEFNSKHNEVKPCLTVH